MDQLERRDNSFHYNFKLHCLSEVSDNYTLPSSLFSCKSRLEKGHVGKKSGESFPFKFLE
jgi:hypothetical protein